MLPGLVIASSFCGCKGDSAAASSNRAQPASESAPTVPTAEAVEPKAVDHGDAVLHFNVAKKTLYRGLHDKLHTSKTLTDLLRDVNQRFAWPRDVDVWFKDCGEINAFYEPSPPKVVICHELIDHLVDIFDPHIQNQERADDMAIGATAFVLLHELGHALIDAHEVPITGRVEDAVDQLATWLLVTRPKGGGDLALKAATWFALAQGEKRAGEMLWDEHSLDTQRFYNIACWVYGSNPSSYSYLVEDGRLPEERARFCEGEYADFASSFDALLRDVELVDGSQQDR